MDTFYNEIIDDIPPIPLDADIYQSHIDALYPQKYTYPDIVKHIALLKAKVPTCKYPTEEDYVDTMKSYYETRKYLCWDDDTEEQLRTSYNRPDFCNPRKQRIDQRDIEISKILKSRARGLTITISPANKSGSYELEKALYLIEKAKTLTNCKYLKAAEFWMECHTDGSDYRPHIHMAATYDQSDNKNVGRIAAYIRRKFPKTSCHIERKHDITYLKNYLTGKASTKAKQLLKAKDFEYREKNDIPHLFKF